MRWSQFGLSAWRMRCTPSMIDADGAEIPISYQNLYQALSAALKPLLMYWLCG